jgi:4-carboxymuconolactone decarboxylase
MRLQMEQRASLPKALSELAILVTARHWSATYAWCRHAGQAIKAGLEEAEIDALGHGRQPHFAEAHANIVHTVAWQLLTTGRLESATRARASAAFGQPAFVELVSEVGYACIVSLANTTFEPDPPNNAPDYLAPGPAPVAPVGAPMDGAANGTIGGATNSLIGAAARGWEDCPQIAECARHYDEVIRTRLALPPITVWTVILMVARHWLARADWPSLRRQAAAAGLDDAVIDALERGVRPLLSDPVQAIAYDFVAEMLTDGRAGDTTFAKARDILGFAGMIELPAIIGFVSMVSLVGNVFAADGR